MRRPEFFADHFLRHREVTQALATRLPDERASFTPWPGAFTLAGLIAHMAATHHMFVNIALGREWAWPDPAALPQDMAGVRALLDDLTARDAADIAAMTPDALAGPLRSAINRDLPPWEWLDKAREHEIHHKGQLMLYARLCGEEVPFFRSRG